MDYVIVNKRTKKYGTMTIDVDGLFIPERYRGNMVTETAHKDILVETDIDKLKEKKEESKDKR